MELVRRVVQDAAIGVALASAPEGLATIHRPGCAAVIWRRQPLPTFQSWIDRLDPDQLPRAKMLLNVSGVRDVIRTCCDVADMPDCRERDIFVDDVAALAHCLSQIFNSPLIRLRLEAYEKAEPENFHIDEVAVQLICTYRGPGTQYAISTDGATPTRVFETPTGSPIVLKGTEWPEGPVSGLLHRSPHRDGVAETSFRLALEPVELIPDERPQLVH